MGIDVTSLDPGEGGEQGPRPSSNAEVARLFDEVADILEVKGDQPYRVNAYRTAARNVGSARERLETLFREGRLREIRGVGEALEAKIVEFLSTGRMEYYDRVTRDFPPGLATLLGVPGLGPTRARAIYEQLGLTTVADLERAARDQRLQDVPGFGDKAVEKLVEALDRMKERTTRNLLSTGWQVAEDALHGVEAQAHPVQASVAGSTRRMLETVGNVDLIVAADDPEPNVEALLELPNLVEVIRRDRSKAAVLLYGGVEVRLYVASPAVWGAALAWRTGSPAHVRRLEAMARERGLAFSGEGLVDEASGQVVPTPDEPAFYERLGLPWIPPELREDSGEIEAGLAGALPRLVDVEDLRGDLHCHTNWTDGAASLEDMAAAAKARGYEYMALTDHSQALTVARGLTPERLQEERRLVNRVNHKLAPFTVLLGTEMDILRDGSLDFPDEVLASLDYVSASVHSAFGLKESNMTSRIVRAISNPLVDTLNHPHGRILRRREAYAVDMGAVIRTAASAGCALELNAQPDRLDLDGTWARRAKEAGARFTISSDAHSTRNLDLMRFGVGSARRGWLTADDVLNTRSLEDLRALLTARRTAAART